MFLLGQAEGQKSFRKRSAGMKFIAGSVYDLPAPVNLSAMWTMGSVLGLMLVSQILSGILLSFHYIADSESAFRHVVLMERDVVKGWFWRSCHANGASVMMFFLYMHTARGLYFDSFATYPKLWRSGALLMLVTMGVCFLGYVLPWGQMSFWGATVITNLFTVIPVCGDSVVRLMWGGYSVGGPTLNRFYSFHFLLPFSLLPLVGVHLYLLHEKGSSNPLGVDGDDGELIPFYPTYLVGDVLSWAVVCFCLSVLINGFPDLLGEPDNWIPADPLSTPPHIKPEWYFLPFYAILRSIPHKTGGVVAMAMAIITLFLLPSFFKHSLYQGVHNTTGREFFFGGFVANWIMLGWVGACPLDEPFLTLGVIHTVSFFTHFCFDHLYLRGAEEFFKG